MSITRWMTETDEVCYDTQDECIAAFVEQSNPERLPETLTLRAMRPFAVDPERYISDAPPGDWGYSGGPAGWLLELWEDDEELGKGRNDWHPVTPAMLKAERVFVAAMIAEYQVWAHDDTGETVTVNVREWVAAHPKEVEA